MAKYRTPKGLIPFDQPLNEDQKHLAASCEPMVIHLAKKATSGNNSYDDLIDAGYMGLMRAAQTYDKAKGAFTTHAFGWIRKRVLQARRRIAEGHARKELDFDIRDLPGRPDEEAWFDPNEVLKAFGSLPDHLKAVVQYRIWDGDSYDSAGKTLGCDRKTVMAREAKAFKILRGSLRQYAGEAS